jgi:hypothetical protein
MRGSALIVRIRESAGFAPEPSTRTVSCCAGSVAQRFECRVV